MVQEKPSPLEISRVFEQPEGSLSFYSDVAQVMGTGNEVLLQFYETIPGPPGPSGTMQLVRTRLRATIVVSYAHAANIGNLLIQHSKGSPTVQPQPKGETK
jgi:hypothetical protein